MKKELIYREDGICKICEQKQHTEECPGQIVDQLKVNLLLVDQYMNRNSYEWQIQEEADSIDELQDEVIAAKYGLVNEGKSFVNYDLYMRWQVDLPKEKREHFARVLIGVEEMELEEKGYSLEREEGERKDWIDGV